MPYTSAISRRTDVLKIIWIAVAIVTVGMLIVFVVASTKPAMFHVERSATIAASPDHITPLLNNFHRWDAWSPWAKLDPNMRTAFSGPAAGPGAVYTWEGNRKVGQGRMEVLSSTQTDTSVKLDFLSPFESHNTSNFHLAPEGNATIVTWSMDGPNTFLGKVMSVFVSMDRIIGKDFESGLANLKTAAER